MSFMDQNSVDDILAQVQSTTNAIQDSAQQAVNQATESLAEIAGEMEAPATRTAATAAPTQIDGGVFPGGDMAAPAPRNMPDVRCLLAIEVPVIVQLGMRRLSVGEVMRLAVGAIIEFGKSAEEDLDLLVNNKPIGKGYAVKVGENFGIKINRIGSVKETIRKLGAI
jgi:flagellar motor switch protein FliN/FliY